MKRFTDLIISLFGLILLSPIILPVLLIVWLQDFHNPFYVAQELVKMRKFSK